MSHLNFGLNKRKMRRLLYHISLMMFVFSCFELKTQAQFLPEIPEEQFIMHTDRDLYIAGEELWFDATNILPPKDDNLQSKVLYVELYNRELQPVVREKFGLTNGHFSGGLTLPDGLQTDYYFLRVYTQLLRNYPPEFYPPLKITVINPELPVQKTGKQNNTSTWLPSQDSLSPSPQELSSSDFNVEINESIEKVKLEITTSDSVFEILQNQELHITFMNAYGNKKQTFQFPLKTQRQAEVFDLTPGLYFYRITDLLAKVYYTSALVVNSVEDINCEIALDKKVYKQGEAVHLTVVPDSLSQFLSYAVYVVKKGTVLNTDDLYQELLQRPDQVNISKVISLPADKQKQVLENYVGKHPDLIRDLFDKKSGQVEMKYIPETRAATISGVVLDQNTSQPLNNVPVFLSELDDYSRVHLFRTKENGCFSFPLYNLSGDQNLYLSTLDKEESQREIKIVSDFTNDYLPVNAGYPVMDTAQRTMLEQLYLNYQLSDYTFRPVKEQHTYNYYSLFGFLNPNITIRLADYIDLPDMETVINEIVPFVRAKKRKGHFAISVFDDKLQMEYQKPLILIDNIPVDDVADLMKISPALVQEIRVINRIYYLGDFLLQGVVMIHTKEGRFGGISIPDDAVFIKYKTLSSQTSFIPVQGGEDTFRNVLFWSSGNMPADLPTTFAFYTSQHLSEYDIIFNGITTEGIEFECRKSFKVEK